MYTIELKYYRNNGSIAHFFFPSTEIELAKDYLTDAMNTNCVILLWRIVPTEKIQIA